MLRQQVTIYRVCSSAPSIELDVHTMATSVVEVGAHRFHKKQQTSSKYTVNSFSYINFAQYRKQENDLFPFSYFQTFKQVIGNTRQVRLPISNFEIFKQENENRSFSCLKVLELVSEIRYIPSCYTTRTEAKIIWYGRMLLGQR